MLLLLQTPRWTVPTAVHDLPATLPGWLVAFLAVQSDWVNRDRLLALFWPDAASVEAHHNLRMNLLRVRQLLLAWGLDGQLQSERRRVRLVLATDVRELRQALAARDAERALVLYERPFLDGMSFTGFAAFQEWVEVERTDMQTQWRETLLGLLDSGTVPPARTIDVSRRLLAFDALDETAMTHQIAALAASGRQPQATQAYVGFCERLMRELGTAPSASLQSLGQQLTRVNEVADARQVPGATQRDAFVGRALELTQLRAMLMQSGSRLVTLLGPGGVGKSRSARELTRRLQADPAIAVHWVALASAVDADEALFRLAAQLGLSASSAAEVDRKLRSALANRACLLVFDNAEQVEGLGQRLHDLLQACGQLRCLVTSRVLLQVAGERVFALEGLAMPEPGDMVTTADEARGFDALRLLESRARSVDAGFDLSRQLGDCIALVRCVGGWPLAIEIAASLLDSQPAADLVADLAQSLDTLAAPSAPRHARHASVRASLVLSWRLLPAEHQRALACLSVFKDGFTRASAIAVTGVEAPMLAALAQRLLVHGMGGGRSTLHPLVAQFSAERLADEPALWTQAAGRHGQHFMRRLQAFGDRSHVDGAGAANAIETDLGNFRTAWQWQVAQRQTPGLGQAAQAWTHFCNAKGRARELAALLESALALALIEPADRVKLLLALANARYRGGDLDAAIAMAREAAATADEVPDAVGARAALNQLALVLVQRGFVDEAATHAQDALDRARAAAADTELGSIANTCAIVARARGDLTAAAALYEEAITLHRRLGNLRGQALCLNNLGNVRRSADDLPAAQACFEQCLRLCDQHGIASTRAFALGNLGAVALASGRLDAARLYADRTLAEPAVEPAMVLGACSVQVQVAIAQHRLDDAAGYVRRLATLARAVGLHSAMNEAIVCHARLLIELGQQADAAARLCFVCGHVKASSADRHEARRARALLDFDDDGWAQAEAQAQGLDFDVLLESAAQAIFPTPSAPAAAPDER